MKKLIGLISLCLCINIFAAPGPKQASCVTNLLICVESGPMGQGCSTGTNLVIRLYWWSKGGGDPYAVLDCVTGINLIPFTSRECWDTNNTLVVYGLWDKSINDWTDEWCCWPTSRVAAVYWDCSNGGHGQTDLTLRHYECSKMSSLIWEGTSCCPVVTECVEVTIYGSTCMSRPERDKAEESNSYSKALMSTIPVINMPEETEVNFNFIDKTTGEIKSRFYKRDSVTKKLIRLE